ncbi:PREDICTED: E3 ubiquitin-protein ligase Os04g0590900-like [Ipomoea nil]|uniref:E3 ubiquitin-protein ligase Os04g0590900-like n=1 Tax=Ipomoea nil TaxID=35883 RepID=UPI000900E6AD|nr:PREDICTED: E3 ubiquitin-protein ligase Os04g0590900-like [Ipomoea nil]
MPSPSPTVSPGIDDNPPWDSSIIALVGIVCMIFLLLSYYKLLQRQCCEFRSVVSSYRGPGQMHLLDEQNREEPSSSSLVSCGLDSYVVHALPITPFRKANQERSSDCAVCLGEFEEGEWIKHLPNCSHVFHVSCIDTWFQTHSSCPLCRSFVYCVKVQQPEFSFPFLEPLPREEIHRQRLSHYQNLQSQTLHSSSL